MFDYPHKPSALTAFHPHLSKVHPYIHINVYSSNDSLYIGFHTLLQFT